MAHELMECAYCAIRAWCPCPPLFIHRPFRACSGEKALEGGCTRCSHEAAGFRPRSRIVWRGDGCGRPNRLRYGGVRSGRESTHCPAGGPLRVGDLYWKQQRYEEASREFQAELKNQPQHGQALAYLGDVEMHLDHEQSATELLQRALAVDSNLRLAHLDLGILLSGKDSSGAARHFREAIRIDSSKPDAHYRLGRLLSSLGRDEEAQAEFEQVKKLAAQEPPPPLIRLPGRKLP